MKCSQRTEHNLSGERIGRNCRRPVGLKSRVLPIPGTPLRSAPGYTPEPLRGVDLARKGLLGRAEDFAHEPIELGNPLRCAQDLRELMDESTHPLQIDMVAVQRE
jgi:hypothetical protein